jgi:hypothetical protein
LLIETSFGSSVDGMRDRLIGIESSNPPKSPRTAAVSKDLLFGLLWTFMRKS